MGAFFYIDVNVEKEEENIKSKFCLEVVYF